MEVTLPETLVVGNRCFFATGNILTSVDVDRGEFKVPCVTYMSRLDRPFRAKKSRFQFSLVGPASRRFAPPVCLR